MAGLSFLHTEESFLNQSCCLLRRGFFLQFPLSKLQLRERVATVGLTRNSLASFTFYWKRAAPWRSGGQPCECLHLPFASSVPLLSSCHSGSPFHKQSHSVNRSVPCQMAGCWMLTVGISVVISFRSFLSLELTALFPFGTTELRAVCTQQSIDG